MKKTIFKIATQVLATLLGVAVVLAILNATTNWVHFGALPEQPTTGVEDATTGFQYLWLEEVEYRLNFLLPGDRGAFTPIVLHDGMWQRNGEPTHVNAWQSGDMLRIVLPEREIIRVTIRKLEWHYEPETFLEEDYHREDFPALFEGDTFIFEPLRTEIMHHNFVEWNVEIYTTSNEVIRGRFMT